MNLHRVVCTIVNTWPTMSTVERHDRTATGTKPEPFVIHRSTDTGVGYLYHVPDKGIIMDGYSQIGGRSVKEAQRIRIYASMPKVVI